MVGIRIYARPQDRPALLALVRAEERAALEALKRKWVWKEQAERQARQRAFKRAAVGVAARLSADVPDRPRAHQLRPAVRAAWLRK